MAGFVFTSREDHPGSDADDERVWEDVRVSGETLWAMLGDDACGSISAPS